MKALCDTDKVSGFQLTTWQTVGIYFCLFIVKISFFVLILLTKSWKASRTTVSSVWHVHWRVALLKNKPVIVSISSSINNTCRKAGFVERKTSNRNNPESGKWLTTSICGKYINSLTLLYSFKMMFDLP